MITNPPVNFNSKIIGIVFVLAAHFGLLYLAMSYKLIPAPQEAVTLMVDLINPPKKDELKPPEPPKPEPPKLEPPKKVELVKQKTISKPIPNPTPVLAAEVPVVAPTDTVASPAPAEPVKIESGEPLAAEAVVVDTASSKVATPVHMSELAVGCSDRPEPTYPPASRRTGEQGTVKLRVELDEEGRIDSVRVVESSRHPRLDNAGIVTVKNWKCAAATRDGRAVRAIAIQTFDFILEGN